MTKNKEELSKIRKKAKVDGAAFELRVRKDLTEKGWIVDKFGLNVEFEKFDLIADLKIKDKKIAEEQAKIRFAIINGKIPKGKLIQAKNKWAGPGRPMMMGAGFCDFVCFRTDSIYHGLYEVIGVECKCNGYLTQLEKQKCRWLLDNQIFSKILIAEKTKVKNRVVIVYHDFEIKYEKNQ